MSKFTIILVWKIYVRLWVQKLRSFQKVANVRPRAQLARAESFIMSSGKKEKRKKIKSFGSRTLIPLSLPPFSFPTCLIGVCVINCMSIAIWCLLTKHCGPCQRLAIFSDACRSANCHRKEDCLRQTGQRGANCSRPFSSPSMSQHSCWQHVAQRLQCSQDRPECQ